VWFKLTNVQAVDTRLSYKSLGTEFECNNDTFVKQSTSGGLVCAPTDHSPVASRWKVYWWGSWFSAWKERDWSGYKGCHISLSQVIVLTSSLG